METITVKIEVTFNDGKKHYFTEDVDLEKFVFAAVLTFMGSGGYNKQGPSGMNPGSFYRMVPGIFNHLHGRIFSDEQITEAEPSIKFWKHSDWWLLLEIFSDPKRWVFCHRDRTNGMFKYVLIPEGWGITDDGCIQLASALKKARISSESVLYPGILLFPQLASATIRLLEMIDSGDGADPLYILRHSPQPFKGLGTQLRNELSGIHDQLHTLLLDQIKHSEQK